MTDGVPAWLSKLYYAIVEGGYTSAVMQDGLFDGEHVNGDLSQQTVDRFGALLIRPWKELGRTYSASILGLASAASATDIFTIAGNSTTIVNVTRVEISATQTTGGEIDIQLLKRSAANTAGTSSVPAKVSHDSSDPAASASVLAYTANPSALGTSLGALRVCKIPAIAPASPQSVRTVFDFGEHGKGIRLKGANELLAINLNGVTVTGGSFDISVEWIEYVSPEA